MNAPATLYVYFTQQNAEKTVVTATNPKTPLVIETITLKIAPTNENPQLNPSFKITGPNKISDLDDSALLAIANAFNTRQIDFIFTSDTTIYHIDSSHATSYQSLGGIISLAGKTIELECLGETYRCELPLLSDVTAFGAIVAQGYFVFNIAT